MQSSLDNENGLTVEPFGDDLDRMVMAVETLDQRLEEATQDYLNSHPIVHLTEQFQTDGQHQIAYELPLYLKDIGLLAAITQAPLALRGSADRGKTALAERILNGFFGPHGKGFWKIEGTQGVSHDDLTDVDVERLTKGKLSEAISGAKWISLPGQILDELNRSHSKLTSTLLHLVDGQGFHVRGGVFIPVGAPYKCRGVEKRYCLPIATANITGSEYSGCYEEDYAMRRRLVLSINLDDVPPTSGDVTKLLFNHDQRAKRALPHFESLLGTVISVYESLPAIELSSLAYLFLHYLSSGHATCVVTRSGRKNPALMPAICDKCHLAKSTPFCKSIGGLTEGLLLWVKDLCRGIAALRAVKVLREVREDCEDGRVAQLQTLLNTKAGGEELYARFRSKYLENFCVEGEDVVVSYTLLAPDHVWLDKQWLKSKPEYENREGYLFADVALTGWRTLQHILTTHRDLFEDLARGGEVPPTRLAEVESLVTTEDAAILSVITAIRESELPLNLHTAMRGRRVA